MTNCSGCGKIMHECICLKKQDAHSQDMPRKKREKVPDARKGNFFPKKLNSPQTKIERLFERAKRDLEEEKDHIYNIYINKKAMKMASEKEGIKPKKLIEKVFREWLIEKGYLK